MHPSSSPQDVCNRFLDLERREGLFDLAVGGVAFWEHVRFYAYHEIGRELRLHRLRPCDPALGWRYLLNRSRQLAGAVSGVLSRNPFRTGRKSLLVSGCPRRSRDEAGVWWDPCFDPVLDTLPGAYYYIERFNDDRHHRPTRTRDVHYHDLLSLLAAGYRYAFRLAPTPRGEGLLLRYIEELVRAEFGVAVDVSGLTRATLRTRQVLRFLYQRLLDLVRPRVALFASINTPERTFIEVCKERAIPTVEVQHGVIGSTDLCYAFPPNVPLRAFADWLFVHGPYWQSCLRLPLPSERVVAVGNAYLTRQVERSAGQPRGDAILFLSQPTVAADLIPAAIRLASDPHFAGRVVYRLHPYETDWRTRYPALAAAPLTISEPAEEPLYPVLLRAAVQVGVNSAALFEGLAFGLRTVLLPCHGVEQMHGLIERGLVVRAEPDALPDAIDAAPAARPHAFFSNEPVPRFRRAVDQVLATPTVSVARAAA